MAQTNVQAFSGDVEISSNLAVGPTGNLFVDTVTGRVGIGTTNPMNSGLQIANSYFASGGSTDHFNPQIFITGDSGTAGDQISAIGFSGNSTADAHQRMVGGGIYYKGGAGSYGVGGYLGLAVADLSTSGDDPYGLTEGELASHTRLAIVNDGNVGIGTTDPSCTLDVRGSGQYAGIFSTRLWLEVPGDNSGDGSPDDNTGSPWYGLGYDNLAWNDQSYKYSGDIPILSGFSGVALRSGSGNLVLTGAGNVGIGSVSPDAKFNLLNQHNSKNCFNSRSENTNNSYYSLINQRALNFSGDPLIEVKTAEYQEGQASTGPSFQVTGREGTPILCVKQSAQVGIGTNSNGRLRVKTQGCNVGGAPDKSQFSISQYTSGSSLHLFAGVPGPDNHTGDARLWSLRPGLAWTQISFQATNFAFYPVGGGMYFNGQVIHSDDRIKSDEEYIDNALSTIMKLKPQKYKKDPFLPNDPIKEVTENMTEMPDDIRRQEAGLMVQDVWYDAPELRYILKLSDDAQPTDTKPPEPVPGDPRVDPDYTTWGTKMSALDYNSVFVYNIKATQELKIEVDELESQITSILTRLDALEAS